MHLRMARKNNLTSKVIMPLILLFATSIKKHSILYRNRENTQQGGEYLRNGTDDLNINIHDDQEEDVNDEDNDDDDDEEDDNEKYDQRENMK